MKKLRSESISLRKVFIAARRDNLIYSTPNPTQEHLLSNLSLTDYKTLFRLLDCFGFHINSLALVVAFTGSARQQNSLNTEHNRKKVAETWLPSSHDAMWEEFVNDGWIAEQMGIYRGNHKFLYDTMRKAFTWYETSKKNRPRTKRTWKTKLSWWFKTDWERQGRNKAPKTVPD